MLSVHVPPVRPPSRGGSRHRPPAGARPPRRPRRAAASTMNHKVAAAIARQRRHRNAGAAERAVAAAAVVVLDAAVDEASMPATAGSNQTTPANALFDGAFLLGLCTAALLGLGIGFALAALGAALCAI